MAHYFERPSQVIKRYGMFSQCVNANSLVMREYILESIEDLQISKLSNDKIEEPAQSGFFCRKVDTIQLIEEYIK
jgi:hypothetical protein